MPCILVLFVVVSDFAVENVPKHSAQGGVMCLIEKIHVLNTLRSSMNDSAVGQDFNVNESTIILNKVSQYRHTHKSRLCFPVDES